MLSARGTLIRLIRLVRRRTAEVRGAGSDAGVTLTELLVTMGLMSIVSALALTWLLGASSANSKTTYSSFATSDARTLLQAWPALLQVADSPASATSPTTGGNSTGRFLAITPTSLSFNADIGNRPTCSTACARTATTQVTLALVATTVNGASTNKLVQTLVKPDGTTTAITYVGSGAAAVTTGATQSCLFTAFDVNGNALGCTTATPLGSIARIDLAFTVTPTNNGTVQTFQTSTVLTGTFAADPTTSSTAGTS